MRWRGRVWVKARLETDSHMDPVNPITVRVVVLLFVDP